MRYHDKISDGRIACLSCSYKQGFKPGDGCRFHPHQFDPGVTEIRVEMLRIAQHDIEQSDAAVCKTELVIPRALFDPLKKLRAMHGDSTFNQEVVAALGWYISMCLRRAAEINVGVDAPGGSITELLPDDLTSGSGR